MIVTVYGSLLMGICQWETDKSIYQEMSPCDEETTEHPGLY